MDHVPQLSHSQAGGKLGAAAPPFGRRWCCLLHCLYQILSTNKPLLTVSINQSGELQGVGTVVPGVAPLWRRLDLFTLQRCYRHQESAMLLSSQPETEQGTIPASQEFIGV